MNSTGRIRAAVCEVISSVIRDRGGHVEPIDDGDLLRDTLRLDSLDLAVVVVRLAEKLNTDPFRQRQRPVRTVGDLVAVYEETLRTSP